MRAVLQNLPWSVLVLACLTIGLAPFVPQPHLVEKIKMLIAGGLVKPIDIFDLFLHGLPWCLLLAKALLVLRNSRSVQPSSENHSHRSAN